MDKKPVKLKLPLPIEGQEINGVIFNKEMIHEKKMFKLASFKNRTSLCIIESESMAFYYPDICLVDIIG